MFFCFFFFFFFLFVCLFCVEKDCRFFFSFFFSPRRACNFFFVCVFLQSFLFRAHTEKHENTTLVLSLFLLMKRIHDTHNLKHTNPKHPSFLIKE